jgi:hypothetical protein
MGERRVEDHRHGRHLRWPRQEHLTMPGIPAHMIFPSSNSCRQTLEYSNGTTALTSIRCQLTEKPGLDADPSVELTRTHFRHPNAAAWHVITVTPIPTTAFVLFTHFSGDEPQSSKLRRSCLSTH